MTTRADACARLLDDAARATTDDDAVDALARVAAIASASDGANDAAEASALTAIVERVIEFGRADNATTRRSAASACETLGKAREGWLGAVSYTHLTLPTICSV